MPYSLLTYPLFSSPDTLVLYLVPFSLVTGIALCIFFLPTFLGFRLFVGISLHQSKMYTLQFLDLLSLANLGGPFCIVLKLNINDQPS